MYLKHNKIASIWYIEFLGSLHDALCKLKVIHIIFNNIDKEKTSNPKIEEVINEIINYKLYINIYYIFKFFII